MRCLLALVLLAGCASQQKAQQLQYAQQNVIACEHQRDLERVSGNQAKADRTEVDCAAWRAQAAIDQQQVDIDRENAETARARAAVILRGMGGAHRGAARAYSTNTSCTSHVSPDYGAGSTVQTNCY